MRPFFWGLGLIALSQTAFAETDVNFALDWKFEGPAAPFVLALDKGYYAEEGLNVTIDSGSGSSQTIPRVSQPETTTLAQAICLRIGEI